MSSVRAPAVGIVLALLLVACAPGSADRPSVGGSAIPAATLFNPKAFDTSIPLEIADRPGPQCGYPEKKLVGRLDAAVEAAPGIWTFKGCVASAGNVFYNIVLSLEFPDGQTLAFGVLDQTERDGEAHFAVDVRRPSVAGAMARLYFIQTRARS